MRTAFSTPVPRSARKPNYMPTAKKNRAELSDETLARIRTTAFRLFGRHGFDGVSMQDIASATGLTKAGLYWHFRDKDALYADCVQQLHELYYRYVFGPMALAEDSLQALHLLFDGMRKLVHDPSIAEGGAGYWMNPGTQDLPAVRQARADFEHKSAKLIERILADGVRAGVLRFASPLDAMARSLLLLLEAAVVPLGVHGPQRTAEVLDPLAQTLFAAHVVHGA